MEFEISQNTTMEQECPPTFISREDIYKKIEKGHLIAWSASNEVTMQTAMQDVHPTTAHMLTNLRSMKVQRDPFDSPTRNYATSNVETHNRFKNVSRKYTLSLFNNKRIHIPVCHPLHNSIPIARIPKEELYLLDTLASKQLGKHTVDNEQICEMFKKISVHSALAYFDIVYARVLESSEKVGDKIRAMRDEGSLSPEDYFKNAPIGYNTFNVRPRILKWGKRIISLKYSEATIYGQSSEHYKNDEGTLKYHMEYLLVIYAHCAMMSGDFRQAILDTRDIIAMRLDNEWVLKNDFFRLRPIHIVTFYSIFIYRGVTDSINLSMKHVDEVFFEEFYMKGVSRGLFVKLLDLHNSLIVLKPSTYKGKVFDPQPIFEARLHEFRNSRIIDQFLQWDAYYAAIMKSLCVQIRAPFNSKSIDLTKCVIDFICLMMRRKVKDQEGLGFQFLWGELSPLPMQRPIQVVRDHIVERSYASLKRMKMYEQAKSRKFYYLKDVIRDSMTFDEFSKNLYKCVESAVIVGSKKLSPEKLKNIGEAETEITKHVHTHLLKLGYPLPDVTMKEVISCVDTDVQDVPVFHSANDSTISDADESVIVEEPAFYPEEATAPEVEEMVERGKRTFADFKANTRQWVDDTIKFVSQRVVGCFADGVIDSLKSALKPVLEIFEGMKEFLENLFEKFAKVIISIFRKLGVYESTKLEVNVKECIQLFMFYVLYKMFDNRIIKLAVVSAAIYKLNIVQKLYSLYKKAFPDEPVENESEPIRSCVDLGDDPAPGFAFANMFNKDPAVWISRLTIAMITGAVGVVLTANHRSNITSTAVEMFKNAHFIGSGLIGMERIFSKIPEYVRKVYTIICDKLGKTPVSTPDEQAKKEESENLKKFYNTGMKLITFVYTVDTEEGISVIKSNGDMQSKVINMQKDALWLQTMSLTNLGKIADRPFMDQLREALKRMKVVRNVVYRSLKFGSFRYTPFHIQFVGKPGVGKSSLISILTRRLGEVYWPTVPVANLSWAKTNTDYYDNYSGQKVCVIDDMWKVADAKEITEVLTMISNCPYPVPMAHLEDKGAYFTSEVVISTTNVEYPLVKDVMCSDAVHRRRHLLVRTRIDPDCYDPATSKFDLELYKKKYNDPDLVRLTSELPHLKFDILKPVLGNPRQTSTYKRGDNLPEGLVEPTTDLTFNELFSRVCKRKDAMRNEESPLIKNCSSTIAETVQRDLMYVEYLAEKYEDVRNSCLYSNIGIGDYAFVDPAPIDEDSLSEVPSRVLNEALSDVEDEVQQGSATTSDPLSDGDSVESCVGESDLLEWERLRRERLLAERGKQSGTTPRAARRRIAYGSLQKSHKFMSKHFVRIEGDMDYVLENGDTMSVTEISDLPKIWTSSLIKVPENKENWRPYAHIIEQLDWSVISRIRIELQQNGVIYWYYMDFSGDIELIEKVKDVLPEGVTVQSFAGMYAGFRRNVDQFFQLPREIREELVKIGNSYYEFHKFCRQAFFSRAYEAKMMTRKMYDGILRNFRWFVNKFIDFLPLIFPIAYITFIVLFMRRMSQLISPSDGESTSRVNFRGQTKIGLFKGKPTVNLADAQSVMYNAKIPIHEQMAFQAKISRNTALVMFTNPEETEVYGVGNAFRLDGHFLVTNTHVLWTAYVMTYCDANAKEDPTKENEHIKMHYIIDGMDVNKTWMTYIHKKQIGFYDRTDLAFLYCPYLPPARKVNHLFVKNEDITGGSPPDYVHHISRCRVSGNVITGRGKFAYEYQGIDFKTNMVDLRNCRALITYWAEVLPGQSGSIALIDTNTRRPLLGLVMAATTSLQDNERRPLTICAVLTQEMIATATELILKDLGNVPNFVNNGPLDVVEDGSNNCAEVFEKGLALSVVGTVLPHKQMGVIGDTRFNESIFADLFESDRKPAILSPRDRRARGKAHPLKFSITKVARNVIHPLEPSLLNQAVEDVKDYIKSSINMSGIRVLSQIEAITGLDEPGYQKLNVKTSPGIPYVYRKVEPGKKTWIQFDDRGEISYVSSEVIANVSALEDNLKKGVVPQSLMYDFPKDELRPRSKVEGDTIKTRSISVLPMDHSILFRQYHLALEAALHRAANGNFQSCVGITPESLAWTNLYYSMSSVGDLGCDFDISNWDGHMPPDLLFAVVKCVNKLYEEAGDRTPLADQVRMGLVEYFLFGYSQFETTVYQKYRGMCSGFGGTATYNTIGHMILFYYFYLNHCVCNGIPEYANFEHYSRFISPRFYGDDVIAAFHPQSPVLPNHIATMYVTHGWPVTEANNKNITEFALKPLTECTFLKRSFGTWDKNPTIRWPTIEKSVIYDLLHWIRKQDDMTTQQYVNINEALEFAFFHGREFYEDLRTKINNRLIEIGYKPFLVGYTAMERIMEHRILDEQPPDYDKFLKLVKRAKTILPRSSTLKIATAEVTVKGFPI